jgi:hypothetical protein
VASPSYLLLPATPSRPRLPKGRQLAQLGWGGGAELFRFAPVDQTSTCSAMASASSTSMPRYLTVLSILVCPNSSCTARKLPVRR